MEERYDLIVIGAGPGGYVAAIKAAKLGMKTAVVENREVGGTCLNRGCVPAKAMLHAAKLYQEVLSGERFGIISKEVSYDYGKVLSYKNETSESLRLGVEQLLKGNKVERISGTGSLTKEGRVRIKTKEGEEILQAKYILLATGSKPALLPIEGIRLPGIMTSDEMFQLDHVPESLLIIGGGVIGVEFATVFSSFGSKVTLLEAEERLLPGLDKEISQNVRLLLKKRGVDIHTKAFVRKIEKEGLDFICTYEEKVKDKEKLVVLKTPYLLSATGRIPNTDGLLEEEALLKMDRGRIVVKENFETSMPGVFAIGDVIGGIQLAHAASSQGICAVEGMNGKEPSIDLSVVPSCVYTDPEIACVGITEAEAKEKGIETVTGKFLTHGNS
ncbi:MAG: dihydrolipoyl dehydrogenase, partial [Hungatella sp.]|nr:dihydrolipoyl dehydrogenase [Hungatella sp.]